MHRRSFASEETLPKATRRVRKQVRGNAEAWVSTLQTIGIAGICRSRGFVLPGFGAFCGWV